MRKIELIELVKDHLAGGDATKDVKGRYHDEIIANHLSTAFKRAVFDTWLEAKSYSDYSLLDSWAAFYEVSVSQDVNDYEKVGFLPFPPIQLQDAMGILQVTSYDTSIPSHPNRRVSFAYRETNHSSVFDALEVDLVSTKPYFYLERRVAGNNDELHEIRIGNCEDPCDKIGVKMIVPFERMDDYDPVPIPAGKEDLLVRSVIDLMAAKPPEDEINDSKANQR